MEKKTFLNIFLGILLIYGIYLLCKNNIETYSPYYSPYRRRYRYGRYPYGYMNYSAYSPSFEYDYNRFINNRISDDLELGVSEVIDY